jgi:ribosomal protein S18 acetylase RimI-like enzyme
VPRARRRAAPARIVSSAVEQQLPVRLHVLDDEAIESSSLHSVSFMFVDAWFGRSIHSDAQYTQLVDEIADDMRRRYSSARTADASRLVVAMDDDGELCGCAGVELLSMTVDGRLPSSWSERLEAKPRPHMSNLAVAPARRRSGVGRALVRECEKVAREWGCSEQTLFADRDNEPAIDLYCSLGYRVVSYLSADKPIPLPNQTRRVEPGFAFTWVKTTNAFLTKDLN